MAWEKRQADGAAQAPGDAAGDGSLWRRLNRSLAKTRRHIASGVGDLLRGERAIDEAVLDELETGLLLADVGVAATARIMDSVKAGVSRRELKDTPALRGAVARELGAILAPVAKTFTVGAARPHVVLVVGVNGAGKTTLIGKLAKRLRDEGRSVLLAAGDTFRAAAVDQLKAWGARNAVPVVEQGQGADGASVIFDAVQAALARGVDVVLADTAGRLQTKSGLMEELKKIKRVMGRLHEGAPHEVLLVLGRRRRPERALPSARVPARRWRDGARGHQTRRHRQSRRFGGHRRRLPTAGVFRGRRRGRGRLAAVRGRCLCAGVVGAAVMP